MLTVRVLEDSPVTLARFTVRDLGETSLPVFDTLFELADDVGEGELHLDLAQVEYIGSAGLANLIGLNRKLNGLGGHLVLVNVQPFVLEVFTLTRLDKLLDLRGKEPKIPPSGKVTA